jgi:hypothetical protein
MITAFLGRQDFSDTVALTPPSRSLGRPFDPLEQMARADQEDWTLLRLVLCSAVATFLLALATSLHS